MKKKTIALKCPVKRTELVIPFFERKGRMFTKDPRAIHMLRMGCAAKVTVREDKMISLEEMDLGIGRFQSPAKTTISLPEFGFTDGQCIYFSPQAVDTAGKENLLWEFTRIMNPAGAVLSVNDR